MRDTGFVIRAVGLGAAAIFALQPAQAGERKPAALVAHHLGAPVHRIVSVAPARSTLRADLPKSVRKDAISRRNDFSGSGLAVVGGSSTHNTTHAQISFVPVTPLATEAGDQSRMRQGDGAPKEKGPATPLGERKNVTLFRLDPKLGDVSVQPVVGGVNGAQLSVGF